MSEVLKNIKTRQSSRVPFNSDKPVSKEVVKQILEAAKWTPTAHNMQNFEIIVIDDKTTLEKIGNLKMCITEECLKENYQQLSFSQEELQRKKTGILAAMFPPAWVNPQKMTQVAQSVASTPVTQSIRGSPLLLIVLYDSRKRAPASEGDVLGFVSLGCLLENIWLMTNSLGISLQVISTFATEPLETELKKLLGVPEHLKIAFGLRLGYPTSATAYPRVRRDIEDFTHSNQYGNKQA